MFRKMYKLVKNRVPTGLMKFMELEKLFLLLETIEHFIAITVMIILG